MLKTILIVKNITHEGPGLLENLLKEKNIEYQIIDLNKQEIFPSPQNFGALIVCGGPDSANDENKKMRTELARIKEAVEAKIPYLGICLGLQTLVKTFGGKIVKNRVKEIGFRDPEGKNFTVELTLTGSNDPLFEGLEKSLQVFHLHGETVEITDSMQLLATGKFCQNQIVKIGPNAYGIQCHFELTPQMFNYWAKIDPDLQLLDQSKLREDFAEIEKNYKKVGETLFRNFLKIAGY